MARAFVTGGTGFIGGNLVRELLSAGIEVKALVRKGSDRRNLDGLALEIVEGSLDDEQLLESSLVGCRWLFHVAAHYSLRRRDSAAIYRANVEGSKKIFVAARTANVERVVYTSSVSAIGLAPDDAVANELTTTTVD